MMEPVRKGQDNVSDPVKGIGEFWSQQEEQYEFDYHMYNSIPWLIVKTVFSVIIISLTYLLYGLQEIPWTIFGSGTGLVILSFAPFFVGMIMGYSFEKPIWALAYAILIGFTSIGLTFVLLRLPQLMELGNYGSGFMANVWWYGFYLPFLITISFVPAGAMVAVSTNVYD